MIDYLYIKSYECFCQTILGMHYLTTYYLIPNTYYLTLTTYDNVIEITLFFFFLNIYIDNVTNIRLNTSNFVTVVSILNFNYSVETSNRSYIVSK